MFVVQAPGPPPASRESPGVAVISSRAELDYPVLVHPPRRASSRRGPGVFVIPSPAAAAELESPILVQAPPPTFSRRGPGATVIPSHVEPGSIIYIYPPLPSPSRQAPGVNVVPWRAETELTPIPMIMSSPASSISWPEDPSVAHTPTLIEPESPSSDVTNTKALTRSGNVNTDRHNDGPVLRGYFKLKGHGSVTNWLWLRKWVVLRDNILSIHKDSHTLHPSLTIPLRDITKAERIYLTPYCLLLETKDKRVYLSFMSYEELSTWRGEIHSRSPLSNHTRFVPRAHVDTDSRGFTGLQETWENPKSKLPAISQRFPAPIQRRPLENDTPSSTSTLELERRIMGRRIEREGGLEGEWGKREGRPEITSLKSSFATPNPAGPFGVRYAPRKFPRGNLNVGKHASYSMPAVPRDTAATSVIGSACGRLIRRAFAPHELSSLINEVLSKEDGSGSIRCLRADDAQMLIEVIDEILETRELLHCVRKNCLRLLYRTCGHHARLPSALSVPVSYDRTGDALYRGGYADVWKGTYHSRAVAVKVIRTYSTYDLQKIINAFCKEVVAWRFLRHPNVLPLIGVLMSQNRFAMVSNWMVNGDINQFIKAYPKVNRFGLLAGVAEGLIYLHDNEMVHGDLKGANILIDETGRPRLADFGLLTIISDPANFFYSSSHSQGGTVRWMSPELIDPQRFGLEKSRRTRSSDCYALGMVIYETISRNLPFHEHADLTVFMKVMGGEHPAREAGFPKCLWKVMEQCWAFHPDNRPDVRHVLKCLRKLQNRRTHLYW